MPVWQKESHQLHQRQSSHFPRGYLPQRTARGARHQQQPHRVKAGRHRSTLRQESSRKARPLFRTWFTNLNARGNASIPAQRQFSGRRYAWRHAAAVPPASVWVERQNKRTRATGYRCRSMRRQKRTRAARALLSRSRPRIREGHAGSETARQKINRSAESNPRHSPHAAVSRSREQQRPRSVYHADEYRGRQTARTKPACSVR